MEARQHWHIGTMGFGYADWRGVLYPSSLKPAEYLAFYARYYDAVEIDSTFHAAPPPERFDRWANSVPASFRFYVKTPRAITHDAILTDAAEPMRSFVASASRLGDRLAAVLIQYPATLTARVWPQLQRFLGTLPPGVRYAVEFRHDSWDRDDVYVSLEKMGIALVSGEYEHDPKPPVITADFAYLRLIGLHGRYEPMTHERVDKSNQLRWWRDRLAPTRVRKVVCMFNNDYAGYSPGTADKMRELIGLPVTTRQERLGTLF